MFDHDKACISACPAGGNPWNWTDQKNAFRADKVEDEQHRDVQQGLKDPQKVSASESAISSNPAETKVCPTLHLQCLALIVNMSKYCSAYFGQVMSMFALC